MSAIAAPPASESERHDQIASEELGDEAPPPVVKKSKTEKLADLAKEITRSLNLATACEQEGIGHIRDVGERLTKAKKLVGHGEWLKWLSRNWKWSEQTARGYIRVYENWNLILRNRKRAFGLSIRGALRVIREVKAESKTPPPSSETPPPPSPSPSPPTLENVEPPEVITPQDRAGDVPTPSEGTPRERRQRKRRRGAGLHSEPVGALVANVQKLTAHPDAIEPLRRLFADLAELIRHSDPNDVIAAIEAAVCVIPCSNPLKGASDE